MNKTRVALMLHLAGVLTAAAMLWEAEVRAHWVWPVSVDDSTVQRARTEPAAKVLDVIAGQRLGLPATYENKPAFEPSSAIQKGEAVLSGRAEFHRKDPVSIHVPFERSNFQVGQMSHQLFIAGLVHDDHLLQAYRASKDDRFLRAALDDIVAFERVDRFSLVPTGFQWNDHAMANTMTILAEAWGYARSRPDLDPATAAALLRLASRTAERLAKPAFFTYRTNHGIMQSIALLQFAAAFPTLEASPRLGELGCQRLKEQIPYYISPEGVTLEHSAGYHEFGRQLVDIAVQLSDMGACQAPQEWRAKRDATRAFSAALWRPDRTLPVFGNTDGTDRLADDDPVPDRPGRAFSVFPVSGYSVWWSGLDQWPTVDHLSQTLISWSNYPTRAHKHADDLSLLIWSRGLSWLTSVGYWPYDARGYAQAQSWAGANAPHFVGEPPQSIPATRMLGAGESDRVRAIALERADATGKAALRRVIAEIDGSTWVVADSASGSRREAVERVWTFSALTDWIEAGSANTLMVKAKDQPLALRMATLGDLAGAPERHRGSKDPYIGWNVRSAVPTPAPAAVVTQGGGESLVVTVFQLDDETRLRALPAPRLSPGARRDDWTVEVPTAGGVLPVKWAGDHLSVGADASRVTVTLEPAPADVTEARTRIESAYAGMSSRYARFRELIDYRYKLTALLLGGFVLLELVLLAVGRQAPVATRRLRLLGAVGWPLLGVYAAYVYLG